MTSGNMFPHAATMTDSTANLTVLLQSTIFGRILHIFYMKVDMDLEVDSRSAPFARAAVFNAPDNLEFFKSLPTFD